MKMKDHIIIGAVAGCGIYILDRLNKEKEIKFSKLLLCGAAGATIALLPDILEPATNPRHRQLFHSLVSLGFTLSGIFVSKKPLTKASFAGYTSHLLADLTTPMGLPFLW
ncbi:MAG: metal-dependent hydrolase [Candidatus Stahlbacteria bacterium]|nr:MAG: metal-dependent hydrolase [Candidatus Stahlbacteria bacterium]